MMFHGCSGVRGSSASISTSWAMARSAWQGGQTKPRLVSQHLVRSGTGSPQQRHGDLCFMVLTGEGKFRCLRACRIAVVSIVNIDSYIRCKGSAKHPSKRALLGGGVGLCGVPERLRQEHGEGHLWVGHE